MILNKKDQENNTLSTTGDKGLMLKMVVSYSIFLLVILILFYFLYLSIFNNMRKSYNLQNRSSLTSNVKLFEKDLDIMEVYCRQLLQNSYFRKMMHYTNTPTSFHEVGHSLKTLLSTDVYPESLLPIQEVYSYLPGTGYILSPNYFINQNRFYHWIKKYEPTEQENWLKALTESDKHYQFLPINMLSPNTTKDYFMYVINLDDLYYMKADAVVCFVIDKLELSSLFDILQDTDNDNFLMVTDSSGTPFLSIGNAQVPDAETILSLSFTKEDFSPLHWNSSSMTVGKYVSATTGYCYYYSFPTFGSSPSILLTRTAFLCLLAIALFSGGILIHFFSRRNVQPIVELGQELHQAVEVQNQLREVVDSQRPIICSSYIKQLMSGTVNSEAEAAYIKDFLRLPGADPCYNVLYVVVYDNSGNAQENHSTDLNTGEYMDSVVLEALQKYLELSFYCYTPKDRTYALLVSCTKEEEDSFVLKMQDIVLRLHDYLLDTHGIWLFAGIGRSTSSLLRVWESYQQALEAINYTTKNYIFFPYEFIMKNSNVFYYPPEISTKLIHFITSGNTNQVLELFSLIHQENIEERSLPINLLKFLLSDIRNTLLKARFALPGSVDTDIVASLDQRFNEHLSFSLCEDLALTLCRLFSTGTEDSNLISTIVKYIGENYMDPSLGLNKISDEFSISESYFSHMFKEKTGVNFSTYLENIRMGEAARLIKETSIGLNELYIAVGYNNPNSFRRAFKKTFSVTPSAMREAIKTN